MSILISNHNIIFKGTEINENCTYAMAELDDDAVFAMEEVGVSSFYYLALYENIDFKEHTQNIITITHIIKCFSPSRITANFYERCIKFNRIFWLMHV